MFNRLSGTLFLLLTGSLLQAQKGKTFGLISPVGNIKVNIVSAPQLQWSVFYGSQQVLAPSAIGLQLDNGEVWGKEMKALVSNKDQVNRKFAANFYKKDSITDRYNELRLVWKGNHGIIFRVYDDGAAYRFFSYSKDSL